MKGNSNYDKVLLGIMAAVAVGGAGLMVYKSMGFQESLAAESVAPKSEFGEIPLDRVQAAIEKAAKPGATWTAPVRQDKAVPLNKSVLLVKKGDDLFDLYQEEQQLRPPMTNKFLRENNLPYQFPNVGSLDEDGDGFSNLEEFENQTNPRNSGQHPPITTKLFLSQRIAKDYRMTLKSSDSPYQVATPDDLKRRNWFVSGDFGTDNRFTMVRFNSKKVPDPRIGERDVSELVVKDNVKNQEVILVKDVENNLAEYSAELVFRLKGSSELKVEKDGLFRIPGFDAVTYKLIEINEDSAVIAEVDANGAVGTPIPIKKG